MPKVSKTMQFRFTRGELDPELNGRGDIEQYYNTIKDSKNVTTITQGGLTRRPGTLYLDKYRNILTEYPGGSITASDPDGNNSSSGTELPYLTNGVLGQYYTTTTTIGTTNNYIVFQYDLGSFQKITFIDLEQLSFPSSSSVSTEFKLQYSIDGLIWSTNPSIITIDKIQRDYRIGFDLNSRYIRLIRLGTTNLGSSVVQLSECNIWQETTSLSNSKLIPFEFNDEQKYVLLMTDQSIIVYKDGIFQCNINSPYLSSQISLVNYTQSNDELIFFHKDVNMHTLQRQGADNLWSLNVSSFKNIPTHKFNNNIITPAVNITPNVISGLVTLTPASGTPFAGIKVGQYFEGNGGYVRLTEIEGTGAWAKGYCVEPFYDLTTIASGKWFIETGWDDLWNDNRGYPRCGCYYQQRLVLGGFRDAPQTIAASVISDFYNFDQGQLNPSDSFNLDIDSDKSNIIYHLFPHNVLEIYTSGGIFITGSDKSINNPFTLSTVTFNRQTQIGSSPYIRPIEIENGGTLFVQIGGSSVNEFIYSDSTISYENRRLSLISGHLINNPIDASLSRSNNKQNSNYYLQVNEDGVLIIACLLQTENIGAFTKHTTDGIFKNVLALGEDIYVGVERIINGTTNRYLEKLDIDRTTDSCKYFLSASVPTTTVNGLNYLEGKSVWTIIDGNIYGPKTVSSGSITLDLLPIVDLEIGLDYKTNITLNPIENPDLGPLMGSMKSLAEITINIYKTQHILVNGYSPIAELLGTNGTLDESPREFTGRYRMLGFLGWDQYGEINITQEYPLKMTLLNLISTFIIGNK